MDRMLFPEIMTCFPSTQSYCTCGTGECLPSMDTRTHCTTGVIHNAIHRGVYMSLLIES